MNLNDAINLAIDNIIKEGSTDVEIFSRPFEIDLLKDDANRKIVLQEIQTSLKHNDIRSLKFTPISHVLLPKKSLLDFRKCALIHPLDEMKYLSLVLQLATVIERNRIKKSDNRVFSYRFKPQKGYLFDPNFTFTSFRNFVSAKEKRRNINVVASCDIANFYDRLNIHRLECILHSLAPNDSNLVKQIVEVLLFWSNRDSYGLPVGSNASRILAEAALIEIDNFLISRNIDFCRFVDDYRFFAKDAATVHLNVSLFVDRLSKEGLFINAMKTNIKEAQSKKANVSIKSPENNSLPALLDDVDETILRQKFLLPRIIGGYSGIIPTKFRQLTGNESIKLRENDIDVLFSKINNDVIIESKDFLLLVKSCVAKGDAEYLTRTVEIMRRFPQFIPYTLDAIKKSEAFFSESHIATIKNLLSAWLKEDIYPEYILVYVVKFLGRGKFQDKETLLSFFRTLKRNQGSYIGRAVLEQLEECITRGDVLELRDYYVRADKWEKRQIVKIVSIYLTPDERRPFFKNVIAIDDDIFIREIMKKKFTKE